MSWRDWYNSNADAQGRFDAAVETLEQHERDGDADAVYQALAPTKELRVPLQDYWATGGRDHLPRQELAKGDHLLTVSGKAQDQLFSLWRMAHASAVKIRQVRGGGAGAYSYAYLLDVRSPVRIPAIVGTVQSVPAEGGVEALFPVQNEPPANAWIGWAIGGVVALGAVGAALYLMKDE